MTRDEFIALAAEIRAAIEAGWAARDAGRSFSPEWDAAKAARERWQHRPLGRDAAPGDLCGPQNPGEWPNGGPSCRRCYLPASLEGHPHGCPRTPHMPGDLTDALHRCYCGASLVVPPEVFGDCCAGTPPVQIPGGCRLCGSNLCQPGEPDDYPEKQYDLPDPFPEMGDSWVHARCYDDHLLSCGHDDWVATRRRKRAFPFGAEAA